MLRSLEEEQNINMTADIRIIGYTLETRPDGMDHESIHYLRCMGVTRCKLVFSIQIMRLLRNY